MKMGAFIARMYNIILLMFIRKSPAGDGTVIIDRSRFWLRIWWAAGCFCCSAFFCGCGDTDLPVLP